MSDTSPESTSTEEVPKKTTPLLPAGTPESHPEASPTAQGKEQATTAPALSTKWAKVVEGLSELDGKDLIGLLCTLWGKLCYLAQGIWALVRRFPDLLTWLLAASENILALYITGCVALAVHRLMARDGRSIETAVTSIEQHWKGALILLVPLFFRTLRELLSKIKKLPMGMEADEKDVKTATNPGGGS